MKARNTDLLNKDDIERILNSDKEFNSDYKFIADKKRYYSITWISFIIVFTILVLVSYFLGATKSNTAPDKGEENSKQVQQQPKSYKKDSIKTNFSKPITKSDSDLLKK